MLRQLLLPLALLCTATLSAQQVQKCCGTSNSTFLLGSTNYARHTQMLFLPGDLNGEVDGPITHLYFRYGSTGIATGNTLGDFTVRLGQTSATAFTNGDEYFTELEVVYQSSSFVIAPGTEGQWLWFSLQSPFTYSASQTLIVDVQFETSTNITFGTLGTTNDGRKLVSPDLLSPTGSTTSSTWQDIGFDIDGTLDVPTTHVQQASVWPDPATERATLRWAGGMAAAPVLLAVLDASGRLWRSLRVPQGAAQLEVDLSGLDAGMYLLRWQDELGRSGGIQVMVE